MSIILSVLIVLSLCIISLTNKKTYYFALLCSYFFFDQVIIKVAGSSFKFYFILSIFICLFYSKKILVKSKESNLMFLLVFLSCGLIICLFSIQGISSMKIFLGVVLQALTAYSINGLLNSSNDSLDILEKSIIFILAASLVFAIVQYILFLSAGIALGFDNYSTMRQLRIGQIPSFRYEGNAYGKLLGWGIVFCIPNLLHNTKNKQVFIQLLVSMIIIFFLSITRSVAYALVITIMIMSIVSIKKDNSGKLLKIVVVVLIFYLIISVLANSGIINLGNYSLYKFKNIFISFGESKKDASANYRIESMNHALNLWKQSLKTIFFGLGFGNATADLSYMGGEQNSLVGGNDFITVLTSFGLVGICIYIGVFIQSIKACCVSQNDEMKIIIWKERIKYLLIYSFSLGCFSGYMLYPEFWMLFGISSYLSRTRIDNNI